MGTVSTIPNLVHSTDTFTLVIPQEVEQKIRYLCAKVSTIEWSGILFYTYEGSLQNKDLKIICKDIFLKDIGSSGYTEFDVSADETSYMLDHDLLDCQTGLIHSHNTFSAFFSGTDLNTLNKEGRDTNSFVSLIVNNAGQYVAAVTERIEKHIKKYITNKAYSFAESPNDTTEEIESYDTEVRYYDLNIIKEGCNMSDLDTRIQEIKTAKAPKVVAANNFEEFSLFGAKAPTTYTPPVYNTPIVKPISQEVKISYDVKAIVAQLLTASLCINVAKFDIKNWMTKIDAVYKRLFKSLDDFYTWGDTFIEYLICAACSEEPTMENMAKVAADMHNELSAYESNEYIKYYMDTLLKYCR